MAAPLAAALAALRDEPVLKQLSIHAAVRLDDLRFLVGLKIEKLDETEWLMQPSASERMGSCSRGASARTCRRSDHRRHRGRRHRVLHSARCPAILHDRMWPLHERRILFCNQVFGLPLPSYGFLLFLTIFVIAQVRCSCGATGRRVCSAFVLISHVCAAWLQPAGAASYSPMNSCPPCMRMQES